MNRISVLSGVLALVLFMWMDGKAADANSARVRLLLDFDWEFHLGDDWGLGERLDKAGQSTGPAQKNFDAGDWRTVDLPHDWANELPFDSQANYDHGYKPIGPGFSTNSIGWYRKTFTLPTTDRDKRLWLEFDGVYRDCRVFLNGYRMAHHESGYNSFRCDITDVASCGGTNVLAIRVDASEFEGWFYEGAGIYRHVWLVKTSPVAMVPDGIFVYSTFPNQVPQGPATVHLQTQLGNWKMDPANVTVKWRISDPNGNIVATAQNSGTVAAGKQAQLDQTTEVSSPVLWSPETPKLYALTTTVENNGEVVDSRETAFGIRTVAFDPNQGFMLNGKHYEIHGTCNHQDHAGVGTALPDALQYFRVRQLKEMGCNAIRTSHNEPTAELLEACDRLGLLVMDENRLLGGDSQNLENLKQQIVRDRNHPSVFVWSLCNEEYVQQTRVGARVFETMQNLAHQLDPTRLCTAAMNGWSDGEPNGFSTVMDVQGFNYFNQGDEDAFHKSNPGKPVIGTEEASAFYTRGIYANTKTYDSAYDDNKPGYGSTAEEWWKFYSARPWASGAFVWTGFDYRGEASPFHWPNISSEFGILDTCGFPKDIFYYYQSWWTDRPVLHLMPHWDWPGKEGQIIDVWVFSNCKEVELFLNGRSLDRKAMPLDSHLQWQVKYEPGILSAKGYNGGRLVAETKVETTGPPSAIQLTADRPVIQADGEDCSVVKVTVRDAQGRVVPIANNLIHFELSGPGKIIGAGNGDPICHEPDVYPEKPSFQTIGLDDWRMKEVPSVQGRPEVSPKFDDGGWQNVNVQADDGPLPPGKMAVFRADVSLTADNLSGRQAKLSFGMIDDNGWVYVNGQMIGESHDWENDPSFEVGKYLRSGDNTIAVVVKNDEGTGGLDKGVTLKLQRPEAPVDWKRSAFNGEAEVIIEAGREPGELKLTGSADGLTTDKVVIQSVR